MHRRADLDLTTLPPYLPSSLPTAAVRTAKRAVPADMKSKLRYYSAEMHQAAFKLPVFADAKLASVRPAVKKALLELTPFTLTALVAAVAGATVAMQALAKKL